MWWSGDLAWRRKWGARRCFYTCTLYPSTFWNVTGGVGAEVKWQWVPPRVLDRDHISDAHNQRCIPILVLNWRPTSRWPRELWKRLNRPRWCWTLKVFFFFTLKLPISYFFRGWCQNFFLKRFWLLWGCLSLQGLNRGDVYQANSIRM